MPKIPTAVAGLSLSILTFAATALAWPIAGDSSQPLNNKPAANVAPAGDVLPLPEAQPVIAHPLDPERFRNEFKAQHPGADVAYHKGTGRVFGAAFAQGETAAASAAAFINESMPLFGIEPANIMPGVLGQPEAQTTAQVMPDRINGGFKFTAHYFTQTHQGVPVYNSRLTLLTRNQNNNPLVLAGLDLRDLGKFAIPAGALNGLNAQAAFAAARPHLGEGAQFSAPSPVIWAGVEDVMAEPAYAMVFVGELDIPARNMYAAMEFVADAATGEILHTVNLVHDVDVTGNVSGMATTAWGADTCAEEVATPLPYAKVSDGTTTIFTDINGNYTLPTTAGPVDITSTITGQYFDLFNLNGTLDDGPPTALVQASSAPGTVNFLHNELNTAQFNRAEVNAYIHANVVRDHALAANPAYPFVSTEVGFDTRVNRGSTCNAFYSSGNQSINFYIAGGACTNTANSTVVHHEYGHRLINAAGSGQGAFGEGMGDTMAVIISDQACLGSGFNAPCGTCLRNANNTCQYQTTGCSSCGSAIHACGQLISGCVWSTRNELLAIDPVNYRTIISDLAVNSMLLHGSGTSITPSITIDYLTLDDTDGNILNGTPHYPQIAAGFGAHNMPAPALDAGISVGPAAGWTASGLSGGPFTPANIVYSVENVEDYPIDYTVTANQPWIDLSNASGTLPPNSTINVTGSINAAAIALGNGLYNATITFTNVTDGIGNTTRPVSLEIGRVVFVSPNVPVTIPDLTTVFSTVVVPDSYCIADVDVQLNIAHTFIGDIIVELTSPSGITVRLHNRTGSSADSIIKTYSDGTVPVDGPGLLADFVGVDTQGTWTLRVQDAVGTDSGTLNSWSLRVLPESGTCNTPAVIHSVNMDVNPGWIGTGQWAYGDPQGLSGDPQNAFTGTNVIGYNLAGDYPNNLTPTQWLTTSAFDCSGVTGATLKFRRWLGVSGSASDHAYIEVSNNGTTWTQVWQNPTTTTNENTWAPATHDISAIADGQATVYIRWGMGTTSATGTSHGWNIDDVQIWGLPSLCPADITGDGQIDVNDLLLVVGNWGATGANVADINGDLVVNVNDLLAVVGAWGPCD